jgi:hypothetical protein
MTSTSAAVWNGPRRSGLAVQIASFATAALITFFLLTSVGIASGVNTTARVSTAGVSTEAQIASTASSPGPGVAAPSAQSLSTCGDAFDEFTKDLLDAVGYCVK